MNLHVPAFFLGSLAALLIAARVYGVQDMRYLHNGADGQPKGLMIHSHGGWYYALFSLSYTQ